MPEGRGPGRRHPALQAHRGGRIAQVVPFAVEAGMSVRYTEFHPRWHRPRGSVVFLLLLVHAVSQGGTAYQRFVDRSSEPWMLVLNAVALAFLVFHTITW